MNKHIMDMEVNYMITFAFITPTTAIIVLVVALIIFGPGKLPELGKSLGKGIREFRTATAVDITDEVNNAEKAKTVENSEKNADTGAV